MLGAGSMNTLIIFLRILMRIVIIGVIYLVVRIVAPEDALLLSIAIYWIFLLAAWAVVFLHRASLWQIDDIRLGPETPRFVTVEGVISELTLVTERVAKGEKGYDYNALEFPQQFDSDMDDVLNSLSWLKAPAKQEIFGRIADGHNEAEPEYSLYGPFLLYIFRIASRAVREREPLHVLRGVYAAQAALVGGADYRDVLVRYSTLWDAARRLRVHIKPIAKSIAAETPELVELLTMRPAGLKAMAVVAIKDEYGFRYELDETWGHSE
ncbi:MAG: hypothetical protein DHS20C05_00290 [Hyphococcus sp.]|nr:MAG: hypothetical protein DHS20C05_00290 [Marinicaulis sp.]